MSRPASVAPTPGPSDQTASTGHLGTALKDRQITMISIGGVIGAGLFVGSSAAIKMAGPAVLVSYSIAALLVVVCMQMLGEMATANPDTGSFSTYADRALGRWAGFSIGWLYWWFYVLVIPIEAIVIGEIIGGLLHLPEYVFALAFILILAGTNMMNVKNYGELEYWLSFIKVVSIVAFIVVGLAAILGILPSPGPSGVSHLFTDGGFMPNGALSVVAALLTAMFSFQGSEIVTIAAAESSNPAKNIKKAIRAVVWRLGLFYLGSMFVVVCLVAWNDPALKQGSYQTVLEGLRVPYAATIMNVVVLVAVSSCLNSAIYTASRMAYSLARRHDAPAALGRVSPTGVPRHAVVASTVVGVAAVIVNYVAPGAFTYLMASSGAIALIMYFVIALTQFQMRRAARRGGTEGRLEVRMWGFPYVTVATMVFIVAVLGVMALSPGHQAELGFTLVLTAALVAAGVWLQRRGERPLASASATRCD